MTLAITPLYAVALTVLFLILSVRVSMRRGVADASFGDGGDDELLRRIRAHGNFAEYAPMGLILLGLAEGTGSAHWALHLTGALLLVGRIVHAVALAGIGGLPFRVAGMLMTWGSIAIAAVLGVI